MDERCCGYCRDIGHTRPKCPMLLLQQETVRKFVAEERMRIHKKLMEWGLGVGAIFGYLDEHEEERQAIIPSHEFIGWYVTPEYDKVRRSKKCRIAVNTIDIDVSKGYNEATMMRTRSSEGIHVHGYALHDIAQTISVMFYVDQYTGDIRTDVPDYYWRRPGKVLSPSKETDFTRENIMKPFYLHGRLCSKESQNKVMVEPILDGSMIL